MSGERISFRGLPALERVVDALANVDALPVLADELCAELRAHEEGKPLFRGASDTP